MTYHHNEKDVLIILTSSPLKQMH